MPSDTWFEELIPLRRPEYAKQTEALLTDLVWRSPGSSLAGSTDEGGDSLLDVLGHAEGPDGESLNRLVPERTADKGGKKLTETFDLARKTELSDLIEADEQSSGPVSAILESLTAPRSRKTRSSACIPLYPDAVVLQTLHGLVNKQSPANNALIIEDLGWMGGAENHGDVARRFLKALENSAASRVAEEIIQEIASQVWERLGELSEGDKLGDGWPTWSRPSPVETVEPRPPSALRDRRVPFRWFWQKWTTLCNPNAGWIEVLPARRFIDWAQCVLRTALGFGYLWEAEFYLGIHSCLSAKASGRDTTESLESLSRFLGEGPVLATIEPREVSGSQKDIWPGMRANLARGYVARTQVIDAASEMAFSPSSGSLEENLAAFVEAVSGELLARFKEPLDPDRRTAKNQKEFVRYLFQQRSADDDSPDQADLYYLTQEDTQSTWMEPGPEWIVVVVSLLSGEPGSRCTLGEIQSDLRQLGLTLQRSVLIEQLERAGLTTDSPDADEALIVNAGF